MNSNFHSFKKKIIEFLMIIILYFFQISIFFVSLCKTLVMEGFSNGTYQDQECTSIFLFFSFDFIEFLVKKKK